MKDIALPTTLSSIAEVPYPADLPIREAPSLTFTEQISSKQSKSYPAKRLLDIVVASVLLAILSPLFLLIALAITIESRGSVFYIAKRMGSHYRIFDFYKFRTMQTGADGYRSHLANYNQYDTIGSSFHSPGTPFFFKMKDDPRVTRLGKFLRKTSLDELPQLINVIIGDMSLVGNRPLPLDEAATLVTEPYADRFLAPAGVTGLWQVARNKNNMSVAQRVELDLQYVRKCSLSFDLFILLKTLPAMLQHE